MDGSGSSNPPGHSTAEIGGQAQGHGVAGDSIVLEEEIDPNYVPTQDEVREYAKWLGMELEHDRDLFWIAKEGLKAPLPENWKPCKTVDTDEIYYFNFATGESTWDHPCDEYYRKLYEEEKKKKMTKDKAKHDKSKQQAKKDVNQLLGRNKKKNSRPIGKRSPHQPSPERLEPVPSPSASIFDRKPLPGIGRQSLHGGDTPDYRASASSPIRSDKVTTVSDRSPSRIQTNSLVGHRLSQHLSVSVESEDGDQKYVDHQASHEGVSDNFSAEKGSLRAREGDADMQSVLAATSTMKSDHTTALKELLTKHAWELNVLQEDHKRKKEQLEEGYRTQLASQKQQWAATAETQTKKTRDALKIEFDKARTDHSRKLDSLENSIINANARLKKALAGAEEARESARIERSKLDSTLAGLRRQIVDKEGSLQKAYEAARKVKAAEAPQVDNDLQSKLMRVFADLESEREHVSELEGQLKEANSTAVASFSQPGADFDRVAELKPGREEGDIERVTILEDKLGLTLRENENLKKGAAQKIVLGSEAKPKNDHFTELKKALKEAEMRLSEVQQVKKLAVQDATDAAAALLGMKEKATGVGLENSRLEEQAKTDERALNRTREEVETVKKELTRVRMEMEQAQEKITKMRSTLMKYEADAATRRLEVDELRADLKASKNMAVRQSGEVETLKQRDVLARNELHTAQLALHDHQLKTTELRDTLATADHENTLRTAAVEQLKLEGLRLKQDLRRALSLTEESGPQEMVGTLMDEIKESQVQLAAVADERERLQTEVETLKQQFSCFQGVSQTEQTSSEDSQASQHRQLESLLSMVKMLEGEVSAGKRREEALQTSAKRLREHKASSNMEALRLKEELKSTAGIKAGMVSAADLERAVAATDKAAKEARELATTNVAMASSLQLAKDQVAQLRNSLQEALFKLAGAEQAATSARLISDDAVSKEDFARVHQAEKNTTEKLMQSQKRCEDAQECLARDSKERATLEGNLRDALLIQDSQARELRTTQAQLCGLLGKESRSATSQTVPDEQRCKLEQNLGRSQEDFQLATLELAGAKNEAAKLKQELANSVARANATTKGANRNEELALEQQQKNIGIYKREQTSFRELNQARVSLQDATKDHDRAFAAAEEAKRRLVGAARDWREDTKNPRTFPNNASARAGSKEGRKTPPRIDEPSAENSATMMTNESCQASIGDSSDATSHGLAEELLQKLAKETSQRCSLKKSQGNEASRVLNEKLSAEKSMLVAAKQVVRQHKERVKKRQQHIFLCQLRWRDQQQHFGPLPATSSRLRHSARPRSSEDAKRELDSEVHELNRIVKQLRSSKSWLDEREQKISIFQALLESDVLHSDPRPEQSSSSTESSKVSYSSQGTGSISAQLHCLESIQQELDKDVSELTADSPNRGRCYPSARQKKKKGARAQRYASQQGKENTLPGSPPTFPMEYPSISPVPAAPGVWGHQLYPYIGEPTKSRGDLQFQHKKIHRQRHRDKEIYRRHKSHFGNRTNAVDEFGNFVLPESSESELQRWLSRPELNPHKDIGSRIAARERTEHIAKLAVEGRQVQSTVALHVDWLNTLRQEMGLLGFYSGQKPQPKAPVEVVSGLSATVDALTSPRRVMKASFLGTQRAQDS